MGMVFIITIYIVVLYIFNFLDISIGTSCSFIEEDGGKCIWYGNIINGTHTTIDPVFLCIKILA